MTISQDDDDKEAGMKGIHLLMNGLIIGAFVAIWLSVAMFAALSPLNVGLWHALMIVITIAILYNILYILQPDVLIIRAYMQNVFSVASSYPESKYEGIAGSGLVPVFPPGLVHAYTLPLTLITTPFPRVEAVTNEDRTDSKNPIPSLPVLISLYLSFRIKPELVAMKQFVRVIPIIEPFSKDFTVEHEVEFFDRTDPLTGEPKYKKRLCPCITTIVQDKVGPAIGEAVSRAVGTLTLPDIIRDRVKLEQRIMSQFENTVLTESGIMVVKKSSRKIVKDGKEEEIEVVELEAGPAATFLDFNIDAVTLADREALKAMSAEQTAIFNAKAKIAQATGDAEYLRQVSALAGTQAGRAVLAAEALKNLPKDTRLLAGTNLLSATAASLLDPDQPTPDSTKGTTSGSI